MHNKCTILVNSCDSYEDTWEPFFKLLKKYWPTRKFPIILNTETKQYSYEDMNIKVINLPPELQGKKYVTWGRRMIEVLKKIDSEYIIFMLDDFFLTDYVDEKSLYQAIEWMDKDQEKKIAVFSFRPVSKSEYEDNPSEKYKGYTLRNRKGPYRYNCQAALWRKEELIKCFRKYENPWEWELKGNKRSKRSKKQFYAMINKEDMIFKYYICDIGIVKGRWKLPETDEFFKKENIYVDFYTRNHLKDIKEKEENERIQKARERGRVYYFIFRVKRKLIRIKNKIMTCMV